MKYEDFVLGCHKKRKKVVFHIYLRSSFKIRLHIEDQLPRLPGSALTVPGGWGGWVASYPLSSQAPNHVEVELGCDKNKPFAGHRKPQ